MTSRCRERLRGSTAGGRRRARPSYSTRALPECALAEIGVRLSLEPVWPSRARREIHCIAAATERTLGLATLDALAPLGVEISRYGTFDDSGTQTVAAAAHFLEFDGLIVPSARAEALNLVIFTERLNAEVALAFEDTQPVDWEAWRARQSRTPGRQASGR